MSEERRAKYTEADLESRRLAWVQSDLAIELGKINGRLDLLPATIELIARKTYAEMRAADAKERGAGFRSWSETTAAVVQGLIAIGVLYLALKH